MNENEPCPLIEVYRITVRSHFFDRANIVNVSGTRAEAFATARELRKTNGFVSLFDQDGQEINYEADLPT